MKEGCYLVQRDEESISLCSPWTVQLVLRRGWWTHKEDLARGLLIS